MVLKPQDIVVALKMAVWEERMPSPPTFLSLAVSLALSPSQVHGAGRRLVAAGLAHDQEGRIRPDLRNLEEFLAHGIRYVFIPERGGATRGVPTAHAAPPLKDRFSAGPGDLPPVWPDPEGEVRGESFSPLYPSVPRAARQDPALYQLLALVDAVRGGRTRERQMAVGELARRLTGRGRGRSR